MGAGNETGHNVAQHHGLLEHLEDDGGNGTQSQDECQVGDEAFDLNGVHRRYCGVYRLGSLVSVIDKGLSKHALNSLKSTGMSIVSLVSTTKLMTVVVFS